MLPLAPTLQMTKEPPEVIGLVQGVMPQSINEWYVARALDRLGLPYMFQYSIFGGRSVRGGVVVDFVVFNPRGTPVFVQGAYWHNERNAPEDQLKIAAARHWFGTEPVLLEEQETDTFQLALAAVKAKVAI